LKASGGLPKQFHFFTATFSFPVVRRFSTLYRLPDDHFAQQILYACRDVHDSSPAILQFRAQAVEGRSLLLQRRRNIPVTRWRGMRYRSGSMGREIQLDGGEVTIIKCLGTGSNEVEGSVLLERCEGLESAELIDILKSLMSMGYVDSDNESFHDEEGFKRAHFRVNSGYAKDLKDAIDDRPQPKVSKRVRRE
jgi:hypothetical protein